MAKQTLSVGKVNNPTLTMGSAPKQTITKVMYATPGSNGFIGLAQPPKANNTKTALPTQQSTQAIIDAILASSRALANSQPRQVYAPKLDFASINAQARANAENAVNPYYTKELQRFLSEQAAKKSQAEALNTTTIANLEQDLQNKLEENAITQQRTGEDVQHNVDLLNTEADQYQTDTGQQFASDRLQQGRDIAAAGLTGGIGAQQAEGAQDARNTTEERATAKTEDQKQQQQIFKARTFEDLARSGTLGAQAKERGVKASQVNLADFITNQGFETEKTKSALEKARLEDVAAKERAYRGIGVSQAIEGIGDAALRNAAYGAYGGYL